MLTVVLESVEIASSPEAFENWGKRLLAQYSLSVSVDDERYSFIWAIIDYKNGESVATDYCDDFEAFLVYICQGKSFKRCRHFVNEIQERFSLAVHYVYSGDESIEISFPLVISSTYT